MKTPPKFDPDAASAPGSGLFGLTTAPEESRYVVVPVPFEATVSYRQGTAGGPAAVLKASAQVELYDRDTAGAWQDGISMLPLPRKIESLNRKARALASAIIEEGGVIGSSREMRDALDQVNEAGSEVNEWVKETVARLLDQDRVAIVLGGDHSVPFGAIEACAERHPGLGILHLDAHADLRDAYEGFTWSHASIMNNVMRRIGSVSKLVQVGVRDLGLAEEEMIRASAGRIVTFYDSDLFARQARGEPFQALAAEIVARLPEQVYVSFDIDALDPSLCPNTGTPVPGGLSFNQAASLLVAVARSGRRIVGGDLTEVAPGADGDEWDANVGARILYKMICCARLSTGLQSPAGPAVAGTADGPRTPGGDGSRG